MLVFTLSARVQKLQPSTATGIFFGYAVLNGLNLSAIFLVYDYGSLIPVSYTHLDVYKRQFTNRTRLSGLILPAAVRSVSFCRNIGAVMGRTSCSL